MNFVSHSLNNYAGNEVSILYKELRGTASSDWF